MVVPVLAGHSFVFVRSLLLLFLCLLMMALLDQTLHMDTKPLKFAYTRLNSLLRAVQVRGRVVCLCPPGTLSQPLRMFPCANMATPLRLFAASKRVGPFVVCC